jgi:hypothetical protein
MKSAPKSAQNAMLSRAEELTARHSSEENAPVQPPVVAAQSPLHELLIDEIAASIPPDVTRKLRAANTVASVHDWIAAASMFTWIESDKRLSQQFLDEIGDRPSSACLALARTIARTLDPPPPDPQAPVLDRWGLLLEMVAAAIILAMRAGLLLLLFSLAVGVWPSLGAAGIVHQIILPDLLSAAVAPSALAFAVMCATTWLLAEVVIVPRLLESVRALPLRSLSVRVYTNWRTDALYVFWVSHAVILQVAMILRCVQAALAGRNTLGDNPAGAAGIVMCMLFAVSTVVASMVAAWSKRTP